MIDVDIHAFECLYLLKKLRESGISEEPGEAVNLIEGDEDDKDLDEDYETHSQRKLHSNAGKIIVILTLL